MIAPASKSDTREQARRAVYHDPVRIDRDPTTGLSTVGRVIAKYPTAALATATVIGMTLGWLIKRKLR